MKATDKKTIGKTNTQVTRFGLGGANLKNTGVSPNISEKTIQKALSLNVGYFDTAPLYGDKQSEKNLGKVLPHANRTQFALSTKAGRTYSPGIMSPETAKMDLSYDGILRSVDSSLKRLSLDKIDILFIHDPDLHPEGRNSGFKQVIEESFQAAQKLKNDGLINAIGVGMNEWEMPYKFIQEFDLDCVLQAGRYTLMNQAALHPFLDECEKRDVSVITGSTLNGGFIFSNMDNNTMMNYQPGIDRNDLTIPIKGKKIKNICNSYNVPMITVALQFPFRHPAVASVLTGTSTPEELQENISLFDINIPKDLWAELESEGLIEV